MNTIQKRLDEIEKRLSQIHEQTTPPYYELLSDGMIGRVYPGITILVGQVKDGKALRGFMYPDQEKEFDQFVASLKLETNGIPYTLSHPRAL